MNHYHHKSERQTLLNRLFSRTTWVNRHQIG